MHSIRRLLGLDNPNFALQHLTDYLYFDFPYTLNPHERNDRFLEYMVYPRLLALAERAWHEADWELPYTSGVTYELGVTHHVDIAALNRDWAGFATVLKERELPKLARAGVGYRQPTFTLTGE